MRVIFADTSYWIALLNPRDQLHTKAVHVSRSLGEARITTTDEVLTEFLNYFGARGAFFRAAATQLVERMRSNQAIQITAQTHDGFLAGYQLYQQRPDKGYSLTDCISIEVMRRETINDVLSNDDHFMQEGFSCLLRD